jgi:putative membrane protein
MQIDILLLFAAGCVIGLLCFSHLLSWLLKHHRDSTLMFLTGVMAGTLPKVWPWKETLTWRTNSHGEQVPLLQQNLSPFDFEAVTSQPHQLLLAVVMMLAGIGIVLVLEKFADN